MAGGPLIRLEYAERQFRLGPSTIRSLDGVGLAFEFSALVGIVFGIAPPFAPVDSIRLMRYATSSL